MAYGPFMGGLAEYDADERRRKRDQLDAQRRMREADQPADDAMQAAAQAEQDAAFLADRLRDVRNTDDVDAYSRVKMATEPVLTRRLAISAAYRQGIPFDQAMTAAQESANAVIAGIEHVQQGETADTAPDAGAAHPGLRCGDARASERRPRGARLSAPMTTMPMRRPR